MTLNLTFWFTLFAIFVAGFFFGMGVTTLVDEFFKRKEQLKAEVFEESWRDESE